VRFNDPETVTADLKLVLVSRRETGFSFVMQKSKNSLSFLVWRFFGLLQHAVKHLGCHRPVSPINASAPGWYMPELKTNLSRSGTMGPLRFYIGKWTPISR
jgi:hypothetical protein